jgi:hypothetical protein
MPGKSEAPVRLRRALPPKLARFFSELKSLTRAQLWLGNPKQKTGETMKALRTFAAWLIPSFFLALTPCFAQQSNPRPVASPKAATTNYGKLPLLFEQNQGQTDPRVKFFSNGAGYTVFLTSSDMVLSLRPSEVVNPDAFKASATPASGTAQARPNSQAATASSAAKSSSASMVFKLVGAKSNPEVVGENPQPTKANYFIGNDPKKWRTNVATYGQVRYKNVYPGIDLVYYGNHRQVEYDFDVAPGADASQIQFDIKGADKLSVDGKGDLVLKKGTGELHFQAPIVYQESKGQRAKVAGSYSVSGSSRVGFSVAAHDSAKALVIDPVLVYSTFLGGRSEEQAYGIAIDSIGNAFVTGITTSPDFPLATLGDLTATQTRVFLAKLDVSGTTLLWADYISGTSGNDYPQGVAVDPQGNAYITGSVYSSDFPTVNPAQGSISGNGDGFLSKVSADGANLVYSTYLGGTNWDYPTSVAVDALGQATIVGYTNSTDFPVANAFQPTVSPNQNSYYGDYGFVSKLSTDGSGLVFSTYLAGSQTYCNYYYCYPYSEIYGVALDPNGNIYVAGRTDTQDFPVSDGAYLTANPSQTNYYANTGFVASLSPFGGLNYSTYLGGNQDAYVTSVAVDANGSAYVTGSANASSSFPITSTSICDPGVSSCDSAFVTKLNPTGTDLVYSTYLGPNNNTQGQRIKVDANGNAIVLAYFGNQSYSLVNPIETYTDAGGLLIDEIDPTGASELFSTYLGGDNGSSGTDLAVDADSAMYITGQTPSQDFPVLQSAF